MSKCYKSGGCGVYENRPCNECPASKPEYLLKEKHISLYVATLNGNVKDNYMTIAFSQSEAKNKIINLYFKDDKHCEKDLSDNDIYITITEFLNGKTTAIY